MTPPPPRNSTRSRHSLFMKQVEETPRLKFNEKLIQKVEALVEEVALRPYEELISFADVSAEGLAKPCVSNR